MKMNNIRKIALALALVMIIASLFSISVLADNIPFVSWSLSDSKTELKNGSDGRVYNLYRTEVPLNEVSSTIYVYSDTVDYKDGYYPVSTIYQNPDYKDAVWIDGYYGNDIFVTAQGKKGLDAFLAGDVGSFWLTDQDLYREIMATEKVAAFDKALHDGINTQSFEVKNLSPEGKIEVYEILAMDKSRTFAYVYGAIYQLDVDEYWYVNYYELGNEYFDANGEFSYRRGSVTMTRLEDSEAVRAMIAATDYFYPNYVYEDDGRVVEEPDDTGTWMFFWVAYVLCFLLPPIPLIAVGAILPFIKKLGKPKYWFIFMAFAILWLIAALLLGILMIVMMFMLI